METHSGSHWSLKSPSLSLPRGRGGQDQGEITNPVALSTSPAPGAGLPCLLI